MKTTRNTATGQVALRALVSALVAGSSAQVMAADASGNLEEVVVTAEKRAVSLQDVPISAVALSGKNLEERGVQTFEQLQYQVPSVTFVDNGNTKYVNIRGVGLSESAPNQTLGVAVHLDGAYVAREFVFGDAFFDLQDVEVLRGPQGTYSGQNAEGGSIFINSKKPNLGDKRDGFASVDFGNFGERRLGAGSSFTLSDTLAVRVAGEQEKRDSFYDNHGPALSTPAGQIENQPGNLDRSLGRVQLLYKPIDKLEMRLIHEESNVLTDGVPYQNFPARGNNVLPATGLWDLNYDLAGHRNVRYNRTTGTLDWQATSAFKVLANLSYLESHQHYLSDADYGSPVTTPTATQNGNDFTINDHYWTAELNLVSTGDGPFSWTVGAFHLDYKQLNYLNFLRYNTAAYPGTGLDEVRDTRLYLYLDNQRTNSAVFGEVGYQFTPKLEVKAGLRYNKDEVGFASDSFIAAGPGSHYFAATGGALPAKILPFSKTTGRVLVNFKPTDANLIYGTVGRGYKPGGTTPFANTYDSEAVTNYEIGWKGELLGRKLVTSISAFYMNYDNFQRTYSPDINNPAASITRNVDGTTVKGLEAQISGRVADFSWDVSFAYDKGTYGSLDLVLPVGIADGVNPTVPTLFNLQGEQLDFLPKVSWNAGASYDLHGAGGRWVPSLRITHQDEYYTAFYHYDYNLTPSKTLLDVSLAYESDRNWRAEAYAHNATDKTYISRAGGGSNAQGQYLLGAPRQVGVKLTYRF